MIQNYYEYLEQVPQNSVLLKHRDRFFVASRNFFFFFFNGISQKWAATNELNDAANASTAGLKFFQQISQIHS